MYPLEEVDTNSFHVGVPCICSWCKKGDASSIHRHTVDDERDVSLVQTHVIICQNISTVHMLRTDDITAWVSHNQTKQAHTKS